MPPEARSDQDGKGSHRSVASMADEPTVPCRRPHRIRARGMVEAVPARAVDRALPALRPRGLARRTLTGRAYVSYPKSWTEALDDPDAPQHTPPTRRANMDGSSSARPATAGSAGTSHHPADDLLASVHEGSRNRLRDNGSTSPSATSESRHRMTWATSDPAPSRALSGSARCSSRSRRRISPRT